MSVNVRDKAAMLPQQGKSGAIEMKDEQQLHGASLELLLCHIILKSDLKTSTGVARREKSIFLDRR